MHPLLVTTPPWSFLVQFDNTNYEVLIVTPSLNPQKEGKKCDVHEVLEDEWVAKFPEPKPIIDVEGKLHMYVVRCKTFSTTMVRKKF
jgi:hypothetical protein